MHLFIEISYAIPCSQVSVAELSGACTDVIDDVVELNNIGVKTR